MNDPAVMKTSPKKYSIELREVPRPVIASGDVLLEVAVCGVCGTDVFVWTCDQQGGKFPIVLGHEFAGIVREVGAGVSGWKEGDRVVSETAAEIDLDSPLSRRGLYNLDRSRKGFGYGVDGAMTRFVRVPPRCLHRLPDSVPFEIAALTEPCCVAYNATVVNSRVRPGDRIVVFGPGPIGLLCAALARLQGAEVAVVGLEIDRERLKRAEHFGCTALVEGAKAWALERDGLGADGIIDAAGVAATIQQSLEIVRPAGWITKVGWAHGPFDGSIDPIVGKNITYQGSFSHNWPIWERVLALLASRALDVAPLIGGTWPLDEWEQAFTQMRDGTVVKSLLKPNTES
jgi:alcohol dehydrogenase/L-iditol 2-dehydrogenase